MKVTLLIDKLIAALKERGDRYTLVGLVSLACNLTMVHVILQLNQSALTASIISFFVGGQVSYLLHSTFTFHDRDRSHWRLYMLGNMLSLGVNGGVAAVLTAVNARDLIVIVGALIPSGLLSFCWNNFVSHGNPPGRHIREEK